MNKGKNIVTISLPSVEVDIITENKVWVPYVKELKPIIIDICRATISLTDFAKYVCQVEIAILLVDDKLIKELNNRFREKNKPTNVLSFPSEEIDPQNFVSIKTNDGFIMLGDIVFAFETIVQEAKEQNKLFINHFYHLLVHGLLHLLGYNHKNNEEAEIMEQLEIAILDKFGITSPYEIN